MIIVTGGAGFVGANTVHRLNELGECDILVVDSFGSSLDPAYPKFRNLHGARFSDFMDKFEFRKAVAEGRFAGAPIAAILHNGGCSNTLEDNGQYMMDNNFTYSKELLHFAAARKIPFVYASTAAVYGLSGHFFESPENERPLNVYGFSKLALDHYVRSHLQEYDSTVVGLRYFNVYGPHELHKGPMASVIHHFSKQLRETGRIHMFEGSGGYGNGEQKRDFIYVRDVVDIGLYFAGLRGNLEIKKGVVNAGTGCARTFNEVAEALMSVFGPGEIEYVPFPAALSGRYQNQTKANVNGLRALGWSRSFTPLEVGLRQMFVPVEFSNRIEAA